MHGAKKKKKVALIAQNPRANFCVVKPYALIPSYFSHTASACPATQFFASVILEGKVFHDKHTNEIKEYLKRIEADVTLEIALNENF